MKKIKKLINQPGVFFRDYFNKKYPDVLNEILCPKEEEKILIRHDLALEEQLSSRLPVDVVFTWVNDKDPSWKEKCNIYRNIDAQYYGQYALDQARFDNHNELYYALKSIYKNISWVRNVYVVTDNQKPEWISEYPDVIIIDHQDIIPKEYLPTFNSHVIEAHLHFISGLSEYFIYFNDDVFVARPLPKSHFFKSNGLASLFLSQKSLDAMQSRGKMTPTLHASIRARKILEEHFGHYIDIPLVHSYMPLRKSVFEKVYNKYNIQIKDFLINKFRTNNDLNLATFFVPWFSYLNGTSTPVRDICYYFNIRSPVAKYHYKALILSNDTDAPHSFCANDFSADLDSSESYQLSLMHMLESFFKGKINDR